LSWTLNLKSFWPLKHPKTIILFILAHTLNKWFQDFLFTIQLLFMQNWSF
jgi:hypothetical protein